MRYLTVVIYFVYSLLSSLLRRQNKYHILLLFLFAEIVSLVFTVDYSCIVFVALRSRSAV